MAEELSPESKLYVKEEIEKVRKEVKEEVEKVKSKATKTLTTVAIVVGLLTGLGVYGIAVNYIDTAISKALEEKGIEDLMAKITSHEVQASESYNSIAQWKSESKKLMDAMEGHRITKLEDAMEGHRQKLEKLEDHRHTIVLRGDEKSTRYIQNMKRTSIPNGHAIIGVYRDKGGYIFYSRLLSIE